MTQTYTQEAPAPLHERPSVYDPEPVHYTPRDDQLPHSKTSQCLEDGRHEGNSWRISQSGSPMADTKDTVFEFSPLRAGVMSQTRPEPAQKITREQLPPLSSLFATRSHQDDQSPTSYSDGTPVFPAVSSMDPRQPATPIHHPDRLYDAPYFHRPSVRHYPLNTVRPEQIERLGIPPPPPRSEQLYTGPESARTDSRYGPVQYPRYRAPSPLRSRSPPSSFTRSEYHLSRDSASSSQRRPDLRQPEQISRSEMDQRAFFRDGQMSAPVTPTQLLTANGFVTGEPLTAKDGLGPKIWTGTQFLPRFVRQAEVPGEGLCYFYDDGTHCRTVIDGEVVNAHWGVTKAGKPRKRLAIACITCREKKIKCDPDYPRCVQCEKFGRVCKFKNAPRGGHVSPDTPPSDPEDTISRPSSSRADVDSFKVEKPEGSLHPVSPRQVRPATPDSEFHHSKRQRTGYHDFTPVASEASPRLSVQDPTSPVTTWAEPATMGPVDTASLQREWQTNPMTTQPGLMVDLIHGFFERVPETVCCMFPQGPFTCWFLSGADKSADDLMLVYTVLALATVFSQRPEHKPFGAQYAMVSRFACDNSRFSIQLVQSRLLLALYYFANNNIENAWDYCGAALRAASGLKLNIELDKTDDHAHGVFPYGLNRAGFAECRRRTFWSCYLMDRFNGFCSGHLSIIQSDDVFLRLPCDSNSFESQCDVQNPFFDLTTPPIQNVNWTIGSMAYLINVSTIWGDIMANAYRASQRPTLTTSRANFDAFYENATNRLRVWNESLPRCYIFSAENMSRAAHSGKLGIFMTMHAVYRVAAMKLNRYIQRFTLSSSQLSHHTAVAQHHAEDLLKMIDTLATCRALAPSSAVPQGDLQAPFSSPFVGYAIVSAVDILSAKVTLPMIGPRLASFQSARSILAELAQFWQSARNQEASVQLRVRDLADLARARGDAAASGVGSRTDHLAAIAREASDGVFEMREAIEKTFSRDFDCAYA
ncbi:transcription factor Cys [Marssonina coronariae]|uniref:Transcription factor Cys n=1 Tax=Diplocarpon coronariae TaxID=2795749 RepID=A0A218ZCT1_9HELO|nr:transcription factor Cys [Marssonina coronariae]